GGALALLRAARELHRRPLRDHVVVRHEFTIPSICDWKTSKQSDVHATKRTDTWFVAGDMITVWSIVTDFVTPSLVAVEGSRTLKVRCSPKPRWSEIGDWSITFRTAGFLALVLSKGNTPFLRSRIEVSAICSCVNCRTCRNPYGAEPSRTIEPAASSFGSGEKTFASRTSGPTLSGLFTASGSAATS